MTPAARSLPSLACALALAAGCEFQPIARPAKPERISAEHGQLIPQIRLDMAGKFVVMRDYDEGRGEHLRIVEWQADQRCELPINIAPWPVALRPARGSTKTPFYLALTLQTGEQQQLLVVDERCRVRALIEELLPNSVQAHRSVEDERGLLTYRDASETLWLLDVFRSGQPVPLARNVSEVHHKPLSASAPRDLFWLLEEGQLRLRNLQGTLSTALGDEVSELALASSARAALVMNGALYEVVAPQLVPTLIATDSCQPYYEEDTLAFFSPCADRQLQKHEPDADTLRSFARGVFQSTTRDGMTLEFAEQSDGQVVLYAESNAMTRQEVTPLFDADKLTVLDDRRIAGVTQADRELGIWSVDVGFQDLALKNVSEVTRTYRGRTHQYTLLVHHESRDELGTLSVLSERISAPYTIADGVPASIFGGYMTDATRGLPHNPFPEPIVVLIDHAERVPDVIPRFQGRLRALAISGEPQSVLAEQVSSFTFVTSPLPGLLYTIDYGPNAGVWFAAL